MAGLKLSEEEMSKLMEEMTDEEKQNYAKFKKEEKKLLSKLDNDYPELM